MCQENPKAEPIALETTVTEPSAAAPRDASAATSPAIDRRDARRWWLKLVLQPVVFLAFLTALMAGLGLAQRWGLISSGGARRTDDIATNTSDTRYICPMMCTPPLAHPGRCPVCGMELVPVAAGKGTTEPRAIRIEPAARRVANIQTVAVARRPVAQTIRAIGELRYDEGAMKTIAAYVDGRLDRLYADYTGVVVAAGDPLALLYSPQLYSGQIELLLAKKARESGRASAIKGVIQSNDSLYASTRERLILLGMTETQITELEEAGEANSRLQLLAPISGTVIEKLAVEGQYVNVGDPIYRLADLSKVWLMLRLFPEDAAAVRYGQKVQAAVQSLPGHEFTGRVAFIDPNVDPATRTVGVRVVVPNEDGLLRVGDYASATIEVPLSGEKTARIFDPELANKWVSPRHPHVIEDSPGPCPICGIDLIPASQLGFTDDPDAGDESLVVPRDAVLMAGDNSVVYVETEPGRFEIRQVSLGPRSGDLVVIRSGLEQGERVATRGNFLIDSQMQLAGNPSLIDPTRLEPKPNEPTATTVIAALELLPPADRRIAESQEICPVSLAKLGSMGTPKKVDVRGKPVFICCDLCRERLLAEPDKYLAKLANSHASAATKAPRAEQPMKQAPSLNGEERQDD